MAEIRILNNLEIIIIIQRKIIIIIIKEIGRNSNALQTGIYQVHIEVEVMTTRLQEE